MRPGPHVPEVIARFFEYLQESGKLGEGGDWAAQIRIIGQSYGQRLKPAGGVKGVPIRKPADASPLGRNDPCPCAARARSTRSAAWSDPEDDLRNDREA